jgi:glycosyltransferase involved in cell wall biosynthesis
VTVPATGVSPRLSVYTPHSHAGLAADGETVEVTILMPCLNEAETLASCIEKARDGLAGAGVKGEIVIGDNGSTDGSQAIARRLGARVIDIPIRGYGAALLGGIQAARGRYVIMGDSDDSYDFSRLGDFITKLREGYALVMGNRFRGGIAPGAMPPLHRYLGNPVLTGIGRLFFGSDSKDFHCGLRGFNREAILGLDLQTTGMEFASEMVVKASIRRLRVTEVPTTLSPDGRSRPPHLRSWRDGWRHLRFLLLFSPRFLFLFPGFLLIAGGLVGSALLLPGPRTVGGVSFDISTLLFSAAAVILGIQLVLFWLFTKVFAISEGLLPPDPRIEQLFRVLTLETGIVISCLTFVAGLGLAVLAVGNWGEAGFGHLDPVRSMRRAIPATTLLIVGAQGLFSSFFLSVLLLKRRQPAPISLSPSAASV